MIHKSLFALIGLSIGLFACSGRVAEDKAVESELNAENAPVAALPVLVTPIPTEFSPDAMIEMYRPLGNERFKEGKVGFEFNVKNHPFGQSRPINLSINGGTPEKVTSAIFSKELAKGTYRAVAYLVDSQGLVLKDFGNYVDRDFLVGDSRAFPAADEPYLLLNLPADNITLSQGEPLIIDFLVVWGDMLADRLEVKVTVGDFTHSVTKVEALQLSNLPPGDHVLHVELLRRNGVDLVNPFSSLSRRIRVS